jgi:hypothetical protein
LACEAEEWNLKEFVERIHTGFKDKHNSQMSCLLRAFDDRNAARKKFAGIGTLLGMGSKFDPTLVSLGEFIFL